MRIVDLRVLAALLLCVLVGSAAARPPRPVIPVAAHVSGLLEFEINGPVVDIVVTGSGQAGSLGTMVAQAAWSPDAVALMQLFLGQINELTINSGTFFAMFADGATVSGSLSGTVSARKDGRFNLDAEFIVTGGTGSLAGATGVGTLQAIQDVDNLQSKANLRVKLNVP